MPTLTAADVLSITQEERLQGTSRFLPDAATLPAVGFDDPYRGIIEALYCGDEIPEMGITFNEGFPDTEEFAEALFRFLMAHLIHIETDSEVRILSLTYLLKQVITIGEEP